MRIERDSENTFIKRNNEEYKNISPAVSGKRQNFTMFLSIFMVLLIVFLGFAKMFSPDIDITLGDDAYQEQEEEDINAIDSRLKALQAEDEEGFVDEENLIEEDGLVRIPLNKEKTQKEDTAAEESETKPHEKQLAETTEQKEAANKNNTVTQTPVAPAPSINVPTPAITKTYRVYVGMYTTQAQAEVARGILQDAGLGVAPNIKQVSGGYTLQVGAFGSKDAATVLANKLLLNNYPARVSSD